ncbi:hypothetical protein IW261DRAFT_1594300, partial [Armillaria novae-zelandiae]
MTEPTQNIGFSATTGFGHDEEDFLTKNAVQFHVLESGDFSALSEIWLESIWQEHVLYWPPEDRTDYGLRQHRKTQTCADDSWNMQRPMNLRFIFLVSLKSGTQRSNRPAYDESTFSNHPHRSRLQSRRPSRRPSTPSEYDYAGGKTMKHVALDVWLAAITFGRFARLQWLSFEIPNPRSNGIELDGIVIPLNCPSTGSLSVKHGFVCLPVSPRKRKTTATGNFQDLPELIPGSDDIEDEDCLTPHREYHLDPDAYALAMAGDIDDIATAPRRRIYTYNPLLTFSSHVNEYVAESLRREGRGDAISQKCCSACEDTEFRFCCITCRDARLFCRICIISLHTACPTHIIQSWNGNYFDKVPLHKLGMRYQVGHLTGEACPHPQPAFGNHFTVIDTNGIHDVALNFCNCMRKRPFAMQLQGSWLFPATDTQPRTAVTTAALEQFQMLTFMGKISAYEYYHSLVRLTDNTVREWSFIRLLKRAGIGNDHGGWKAAKPGSCAVECLACPRPGINIPESVDPDSLNAWEDTLYVGMDANFRLERFNVSSEEKDPGLSKGLAYFVDTNTFHKHLADFDKRIIQPPSSCSNHEAAKGDKKVSIRSRDLAASGVGGVVCTRHELKLPLCTVDLCVGETQVEMDFGYLTAVKHFAGVPRIVTSYDIACQWSINLEEHINIYSDFMRPKIAEKVYLVPKFHLPGHIKDCQEKYCMSFHIHVERSWAISNGVAASTREMGPGHRREKLDQHFGDFNWHKNVSQASLPQSDVAKWIKMVEDWEVDRNKPNPFARTVASKTEAAMRLQLAQEDAQDELAGLDGDALHTTSSKGMISQGIQLESSQLRRSIESWFVVQEVHMPTGSNTPNPRQPKQPPILSCIFTSSVPSIFDIASSSLRQDYAKQYYRDVRKRLTILSTELGEWGWQAQLRVLEDSDRAIEACRGSGIRRIWEMCLEASKNACRIEWCKARARAHRWREECKLLKVEMDHVKRTLEYETNRWLSHAKSAAEGVALINAGEGAGAYAKLPGCNPQVTKKKIGSGCIRFRQLDISGKDRRSQIIPGAIQEGLARSNTRFWTTSATVGPMEAQKRGACRHGQTYCANVYEGQMTPKRQFSYRKFQKCARLRKRDDEYAEYVCPSFERMPSLPKAGTAGIPARTPTWGTEDEHQCEITVTWFGHACFLVELLFVPSLGRGTRIIFDPDIPEVDAVVISARALQIFAPLAHEIYFESIGLPRTRSYTPLVGCAACRNNRHIAQIDLYPCAALHRPGADTGYRSVKDGEDEMEKLVCPASKETGEHFGGFDLVMISIGAYEPRSSFVSTIHCASQEIVCVVQDIKAKKAVATHRRMWILIMEDMTEHLKTFAKECKKIGRCQLSCHRYRRDQILLILHILLEDCQYIPAEIVGRCTLQCDAPFESA